MRVLRCVRSIFLYFLCSFFWFYVFDLWACLSSCYFSYSFIYISVLYITNIHSVSVHILLKRSFFDRLHLLLLTSCNFLYSVPYLGDVCCHHFIMSRIPSVIHSFFSMFFLTNGMDDRWNYRHDEIVARSRTSHFLMLLMLPLMCPNSCVHSTGV